MRFPVSRLCPGWSRPTVLISGQSECSGCGSDVMLCDRLSPFTNSTRDPGLTVTCAGFGPDDVIVTVALLPPVPPDGADGELPPQAVSAATAAPARRYRTARL